MNSTKRASIGWGPTVKPDVNVIKREREFPFGGRATSRSKTLDTWLEKGRGRHICGYFDQWARKCSKGDGKCKSGDKGKGGRVGSKEDGKGG